MSKWPLIPLGRLCTGAQRWQRSPNEEKISYIDISSVSQVTKQIVAPNIISTNDAPSRAQQLIQAGDVLISNVRPNLNAVAQATEKHEGHIASTGFTILRTTPDLDGSFLFHYTQSSNFIEAVLKTATGASYPATSSNKIRSIPIPLPPLDEQRRIARILDGTTHAINSAFEERSTLFKQLVATRFENCFLQEERSWTTIGKYLESTQYGTSSKASDTGPTPILRMGNITYEGQLNFDDMKYIEMADKEEDKYCLRDGDLLFNRTNSKELVGKTAIYRHDGVADMTFAGYLIRARTISDATPEYISAYLNSRHGKATLRLRAKAIVGMANINASEFKTIPIPAASPEEQSQFAAFYKAAEEAVKMASDAKRLGGELYNSLATRAFAGEL